MKWIGLAFNGSGSDRFHPEFDLLRWGNHGEIRDIEGNHGEIRDIDGNHGEFRDIEGQPRRN